MTRAGICLVPGVPYNTELSVLWGKAGEERITIRAKVAHFPYYQGERRNETRDVLGMVLSVRE